MKIVTARINHQNGTVSLDDKVFPIDSSRQLTIEFGSEDALFSYINLVYNKYRLYCSDQYYVLILGGSKKYAKIFKIDDGRIYLHTDQ